MSQTPNDGGPAFPTPGEQFLNGPQGLQPASAWGMEGKSGMSLRAYYAGQFAAEMIEPLLPVGVSSGGVTRERQLWKVSAVACAYADALIAELNKP